MLNGKEYLETLRDGRVVYLNGEKIDDVTTHPAYGIRHARMQECMMRFMIRRQAKVLTTET